MPVVDEILDSAAVSVVDSSLEQWSWEDVRAMANYASREAGEWGGAPIPVEHVRLVMEPRYPFKGLNGMKFNAETPPADNSYTLLNEWRCWQRQCRVYVCREADGKSRAYFLPDGPGRRFEVWFNTLGVCASHVWADDTEDRAESKLKTLVTPHAFKCYRFVGGFLETSPHSKVTYLFRKLRPTIALRPDRDGRMQILATLCLHPLGYYQDSFAGVLCPTDDVIAHLLMMRADEHQFWKKANHHPVSWSSSGI